MRRYDDTVEVRWVRDGAGEAAAGDWLRTGEEGASGAAPCGVWGIVPQAFIWQGRLYIVRRVLDRWVEGAWWRSALEPARSRGVPGVEVHRESSGPFGVAVADREDPVWRVEACAGRGAPVGVFDLSGRAGVSWRLLRACS